MEIILKIAFVIGALIIGWVFFNPIDAFKFCECACPKPGVFTGECTKCNRRVNKNKRQEHFQNLRKSDYEGPIFYEGTIFTEAKQKLENIIKKDDPCLACQDKGDAEPECCYCGMKQQKK